MKIAILSVAILLASGGMPPTERPDPVIIRGTALLIENKDGFIRFGEAAGGSNDELEIGTKRDDMPKVRLIGRYGHLGSISFNHWRDDGKQEEVLQIVGKVNESDPTSLGGQMEFWLRKNRADGDGAMMLMGVMTAAYTKDGLPMIRWHERTKIGLGEFTQASAQRAPSLRRDDVRPNLLNHH